MTSTPSPENQPTDNPNRPAGRPPKKKRRGRKWLIGIAVVLLLLILLVVFAPTLVSTPPVRSMIVNRVNDSIPGSIVLDDLSIGWTSGISTGGLKVYDEQKSLILEVPEFSTDLTLLKAIRGDLSLGETTADVNFTRVVIDENGVSNIERAFGLDKPSPEAEKTKKDKKPDEPTELPNITGSIAIKILGGTIEAPGHMPQSVHLQPGFIKAHIADINKPINNSGELGYRLGDTAPGTIRWNGDIDIAEGNKLDLAGLSGTEDLTAEDLNLAPIKAFLPEDLELALEGIARASLQLKSSGTDASLKGTINLVDLLVGGKPLNGDIYHTKSIAVPVAIARATDDNGARIRIENVAVESDDFQLRLAGDVSETALTNLAAMKPPDGNGQLSVKLDVPGLANLANQLPNTIKTAEGVKFEQGELTTSANITLKPELASVAYAFAASGSGTRDGKPVKLAPINLAVGGNVIPLGEDRIPQVGDVKLALRSNFASADGGGASLEALSLNLGFDLAAMQKELGQFVEFGALDLNGTGKLTLKTQGDVTKPAQPIATDVDLNIEQLTVRKTDIAGGPHAALQNENIQAKLVAAVTLPEQGGYQIDASTLSASSASKLFSIEKVPDAKLTIVSPSEGALQANAKLKLGADLKRLMDIGAAFSATQPVTPAPDDPGQLKSGVLDAIATIAPAENGQTSLALNGQINQLTVTTADKPLANETVKLDLKATTPKDFSRLLANATIDSSFAKIVVTDADVLLSKPTSDGATTAPSTFEMVQNAKVVATVPEVAKLYAVAAAFSSAAPATAPSDGAEPPPAPLQITGGSAILTLNVDRQGSATKATISETKIENLSLSRGQASYAFAKPIVIGADAELNALESLDRLRVATLNVDLGGIANVTLAEPLEMSDFSKDVSAAHGALKVTGQIEQLAKLLEALQGTPDAYPYRGELSMTQNLGTADSGQLALKGQIRATDFQSFTAGQQQPTFSEKEVVIDNNLVVDPNAKSASIEALNINMPSSQALQIGLKGQLVDWEKQRKLDFKLDYTPDYEKLWPIIMPLLGPESQEDLKELKIAGKAARTFTIGGSYPAVDSSGRELAFNESIKSVIADGGLAVALFDYKGAKVEDLELPISLRDGRIATIYGDKKGKDRLPPVARCNDGSLNLGGMLVDLTRSDGARLSTGKNHKLLQGVTINPLFADTFLGKVINPVFVSPSKAEGLIDVTILECQNVPLSDLVNQAVPQNDGHADVTFSLTKMSIGNETVNKLAALIKKDAFNKNALEGEIRDARIQVANGVLTEKLPIELENRSLIFDGKIRLADQMMMPLNLTVPASLLDKVGEDLLKYLPEGFSIPFTGPVTSPKFDFTGITREIATSAAKAQLGNLLGGNKDEKQETPKDGKKPSTKPAEPPKVEDVAKDLLEGLLKKK